MKTKKAWLTWECKEKITCTSDGEKDAFGYAIWRDKDGKAYCLRYARITKDYAFQRYPYYDK